MSNSLTAEVANSLRNLSKTDLIITVGNDFRRDDGVGPYIAAALKSLEMPNVIDAGLNPENIIEQVISLKPNRIIIIDAADFKGGIGEARIIPEEIIPETTLTTHIVPLNVVTKIIEKEASSLISFIGIQPKEVSLGQGLTSEVKETADRIIAELEKNFSKSGDDNA